MWKKLTSSPNAEITWTLTRELVPETEPGCTIFEKLTDIFLFILLTTGQKVIRLFKHSDNEMCMYNCTSMYVYKCSAKIERILQNIYNSITISISAVTCEHGCISLLVDTTCHVFNVFGFILQPTVIVVSLHTCLYFTPDCSAQLSAKRAFL